MMTRFVWLASLFVIGLTLAGCAPTVESRYRPDPFVEGFSTDDWATVLREGTVDRGARVDYDAIASNRNGSRDALYRFVGLLGGVSPDNKPDWFVTPNDHLAYWINAHNAMILYAAVAADVASKPAETPVPASLAARNVRVGGRSISADEILRDRIAPLRHPKAFVAVSRCTLGTPPLRFEPYDGPRLDTQLADQARRIVADPRLAAVSGDGQIEAVSRSLVDLVRLLEKTTKSVDDAAVRAQIAKALTGQTAGQVRSLPADETLNAPGR